MAKKQIPKKKLNRYTERQLNRAFASGKVSLADYVKRTNEITKKHR